MAYLYSGTFAITAAPSITVNDITPATGVHTVGDTVTINWSTTGTVGNVKIQANPSGAIHTGVSTVGIITGATSVGATRFYGDGSLWWIIAKANNINDSTVISNTLKRVRIPTEIQEVLQKLDELAY